MLPIPVGKVVHPVRNTRSTYGAPVALTLAATPGADLWFLQGAAGKVARLTRLIVTVQATAARLATLVLTKHTSVAVSPLPTTSWPFDSADPTPALAASGVWANGGVPTGQVGVFDGRLVAVPTIASVGVATATFEYGAVGKEALVRGAAEYIVLNCAGVVADVWSFFPVWTEEPDK